MKRIFLFLLGGAAFYSGYGQEMSCLESRNLLGVGYGKGFTRCLSALPGGDSEEYKCKTNEYLFTFNMNPFRGKDNSGFRMGYYLDGTIGLSFSQWYIRRTLNSEIVWQEDFGPLMNFNLGMQAGYYFHESNMIIGFRYFNNYNVDQVRSGYGNADDPASVGLFFTKSLLDADFSYGNDKIPGVLVRSDVWDILRCNLKYTIPRKNAVSGDALATAGVRFEHSVLKETDTFLNLNGTDKANTNSIWFIIGMRL